ncbi:MAG: putative MFS family arabinose efflux permease [Gammaproteobacteria bacterium]|jgi:predicted MFS family arabinose efflux permease
MKATVTVLGITQTLAWASSYYLPAILALPIARDTGIDNLQVFAAFSVSLLISAVLGPRVGRTIDAIGGREVLAVSNIAFAAGLVILAAATSAIGVWCAWLVLGFGMGLGLYDAGFATLGRIYGDKARSAITGITLIAGFASTIGWPLTAWGDSTIGWRATCLLWAAAHVLIALPMNRFLLPKLSTTVAEKQAAQNAKVPLDRNMLLLGFAFASAWMVTAAMAVHLPRILQASGASATEAIAAGMLIGPAQVGARIIEASWLSRFHPMVSLRLACFAHPLGAALLTVVGGAFPALFVILHGAGNGILTIARGTVPLAVFGPQNYGLRLGLLGAPARIAQAVAPLLFAWLIDRMGAGILLVTSGFLLAALISLTWVRTQQPTTS